ncbi:MAG: O-antigen ligase family protein, partial [Patescibacteria group bacterium]
MNIIKKSIQFLLYLSLATPLIFYHYLFYPFVTTKALFFRVIVLLVLLLFLIYFFVKKKISYKTSPLWWAFLILIIVYFLSAVFGIAFMRSFWGNMERATGIVFFVHLFVYFALLIFAFKDIKQWHWLFRASLFVGLVIVVYGLMQHFGIAQAINTTGVRVSSTLGNPAYLGSYLLINFFLALYLFFTDKPLTKTSSAYSTKPLMSGVFLVRGKNIFWKIFYAVSGFLSVITLYLTQTRGAVIGLVGSLILFALLNSFRIKEGNKIIKKISVIFLILIISASILIFVFKDSQFVQKNGTLERITSISLNDDTTQTRLSAWRASTQAWQERPVFGWGLENYGYAFSKYFPPEIYADSSSRIWFDNAHSVLFEHLVSTGLLGLVAYVLLFFLAFYYLFKNKNITKLQSNIFVSLLAGYIFANLFVFDTINTYVLVVLVLAFINNQVVDDTFKSQNSLCHPEFISGLCRIFQNKTFLSRNKFGMTEKQSVAIQSRNQEKEINFDY